MKGTTTDGSEVILTPNEVHHARDFSRVALFIVSGIEVARYEDGVTISAGTICIHDPWRIDKGTLVAVGFKHGVAPDADCF